MKNIETVTISINKEDKERVLITCFSEIIKRQQINRDKAVERLNKCFSGEISKQEVPSCVQEIIQSFVVATEEFSALQQYIDLVCSPTDTEVLEDLSNLKKDSLGVDDRSEQAISLTPDHPKE